MPVIFKIAYILPVGQVPDLPISRVQPSWAGPDLPISEEQPHLPSGARLQACRVDIRVDVRCYEKKPDV